MLEYGTLVACDPENGLYVTANGDYLNLWVKRRADYFENTNCQSYTTPNCGILELPCIQVMKLAEKYLEQTVTDADQNL